MNEAEYDAAKPAPPKPAWWHEMLASAPKTDLDKAKAMLRQAFVIQPLLTVWFTSEPWKMELAEALYEAGYLEHGPQVWPWDDIPRPLYVTDKARSEFAHV